VVVVWIGVDGLDYLYTRLYRLKLAGNIRMLRSVTEKNTPYLWALMHSGAPPKEDAFAKSSLPSPVRRIGRLLVPRRFRRKVSRRFLRWLTKEYLARPSVFDEYPSYVECFPLYNWRLPSALRKYSIPDVVGDDDKAAALMSGVWRWDERKVTRFVKAILEYGDEKKLYALWLYTVDVANHLYFKSPVIRKAAYKWVDEMVRRVVDAVSTAVGDAFIVVNSDHGGRRGIHTVMGVLSVNVVPEFGFPADVYGFHVWLRKALKVYA